MKKIFFTVSLACMISWVSNRVDDMDARLEGVDARLGRTEKKVAEIKLNVSGFMAQSAAMSSLVAPMSPGKTSITVGVGASGPAQAFAVGMGTRFNEVWSAKMSAAYDYVTKQVNGGVGVAVEF